MLALLASTDGAKAIDNIPSFSLHFAAESAVRFNISALATTRFGLADEGEKRGVEWEVH